VVRAIEIVAFFVAVEAEERVDAERTAPSVVFGQERRCTLPDWLDERLIHDPHTHAGATFGLPIVVLGSKVVANRIGQTDELFTFVPGEQVAQRECTRDFSQVGSLHLTVHIVENNSVFGRPPDLWWARAVSRTLEQPVVGPMHVSIRLPSRICYAVSIFPVSAHQGEECSNKS
jgi:hypothetical protein